MGMQAGGDGGGGGSADRPRPDRAVRRRVDRAPRQQTQSALVIARSINPLSRSRTASGVAGGLSHVRRDGIAN